MNTQQNNFSFQNIWIAFKRGLRRLWWLMFLLALIGGGIMGMLTKNSFVPVYTASATFTVRVDNSIYAGISAYNTKTASQLAKTFPYILTSGVLSDAVKEELKTDYLPKITAEVVEDSNLLELKVTGTDPKFCHNVLKSVINNYPAIAERVVGPTELSIVDATGIPQEPDNHCNWKSAAEKGAFLGAFLSWVLMLAYGLLNATILGRDDFQRICNASYLGALPTVIAKKRTNATAQVVDLKTTNSRSYREAFQTVSSRVNKALKQNNYHVLMMSSAMPSEGKTTVSYNLAVALSDLEQRVLLVDCDIRNPSLYRMLKHEKCEGITEWFDGEVKFARIIHTVTPDRLDVIFAGEPTNDSVEILGSDKFKVMLASLRKKYDIIVLDTPPCSMLADAAELSSQADCFIMVVKQDYASRDSVISGLNNLQETGIPIIGYVMNEYEGGVSGRYGYGHGYGYGYGKYGYGKYGYGYGYGNSSGDKENAASSDDEIMQSTEAVKETAEAVSSEKLENPDVKEKIADDKKSETLKAQLVETAVSAAAELEDEQENKAELEAEPANRRRDRRKKKNRDKSKNEVEPETKDEIKSVTEAEPEPANKRKDRKKNKDKSKSEIVPEIKDEDKSKNNSKDKGKGKSESNSKDKSKDKPKSNSKDKSKGKSESNSKDKGKDKSKNNSKDKGKDKSKNNSKNNNKGKSKNNSKDNNKNKSKKNKKEKSKGTKALIVIAAILIGIALLLAVTLVILTYVGANSMTDDGSSIDASALGAENVGGGTIRYKGQLYEYNKRISKMLFMGIDDNDKEKSISNKNNNQSDVNVLAVMDPVNKKLVLISISRDTVCEIEVYDANGNSKGTASAQLALSYCFGDGAEKSCELTTEAVSKLFYDIDIPAYGSLYMNGIVDLVDSVGGVTITEDGKQTTLNGEQARQFVQYREYTLEGNNERMQRQSQVIKSLVNKAIDNVKKDPKSILDIYNLVKNNTTTNLNAAKIVYLAQQAAKLDFDGEIKNVPGHSEMGAQSHAKYIVDEEAFYELILNTFYIPIEG